ncbi:MAG: hypothetical protein KC434_21285 [Anaerolineales bacterium]|nr:hypothetical protein [Anaerolineales bacterium]
MSEKRIIPRKRPSPLTARIFGLREQLQKRPYFYKATTAVCSHHLNSTKQMGWGK